MRFFSDFKALLVFLAFKSIDNGCVVEKVI